MTIARASLASLMAISSPLTCWAFSSLLATAFEKRKRESENANLPGKMRKYIFVVLEHLRGSLEHAEEVKREDVGGTLPDGSHLGVAVEPGDPGVLNVTHAAKALHGLSGNPHGQLGRVELHEGSQQAEKAKVDWGGGVAFGLTEEVNGEEGELGRSPGVKLHGSEGLDMEGMLVEGLSKGLGGHASIKRMLVQVRQQKANQGANLPLQGEILGILKGSPHGGA